MSDDYNPDDFPGDEITEADQEHILNLSDRFIDLANELADPDAPGNTGDFMEAANVSIAMTFAAARYAAFATSHEYDNAHQMRNDRKRILSRLAHEYRLMLEQNLEDFELEFDSNPNGALH